MKRVLTLLLMLFTFTTACAESSWKDAVHPGSDVADADLIILIDDETGFLEVGRDIPEGLYRISSGYIETTELREYYGIVIMEGADVIFKSDIFTTETHPGMIIFVEDGQHLLVSVSFGVVYLSSIDAVLLREYE